MSLGVLGVAIEVMLIGYLFVTSLVGLYTIPFIRMIRPKLGDTSLTHLILNCGLFLILSSALPLLSKILGQFSKQSQSHSVVQLWDAKRTSYTLSSQPLAANSAT